MSRLLKCYGFCGKKYPKEELIKLNLKKDSTNPGLNHCKDCYSKKVIEHEERGKLYQFIQETYNLTFPTGLMLRQIKSFVEERGYSYKNIRFTLHYVFYIKKTYQPVVKFGVSMVPYFHDEMVQYYKTQKERRENFKAVESETIRVTLTPFENNDSYKHKKMIKMEELINVN